MGKGKIFRWLPEHQQEFDKMKEILSDSLLTHHFDPKLPVSLLTDASRQHGLGFALCQLSTDGQLVIITCGSKSLTPTQQRYATIELECLAVTKCNFYLRGLPRFTVLTDHKPLEGIFSKTLYDLSNPRLRRMREKLSGFTFGLKYIAGKTHYIADALPRATLFVPEDDPDMIVDAALTALAVTDDPSFKIIQQSMDPDYILCMNDIMGEADRSDLAKKLRGVRNRLSVSGNVILFDTSRFICSADSCYQAVAS